MYMTPPRKNKDKKSSKKRQQKKLTEQIETSEIDRTISEYSEDTASEKHIEPTDNIDSRQSTHTDDNVTSRIPTVGNSKENLTSPPTTGSSGKTMFANDQQRTLETQLENIKDLLQSVTQEMAKMTTRINLIEQRETIRPFVKVQTSASNRASEGGESSVNSHNEYEASNSPLEGESFNVNRRYRQSNRKRPITNLSDLEANQSKISVQNRRERRLLNTEENSETVENQTRHVQFRNTLSATDATNFQQATTTDNAEFLISSTRYVKISVPRVLPNGQMINEETMVDERQLRQFLTTNANAPSNLSNLTNQLGPNEIDDRPQNTGRITSQQHIGPNWRSTSRHSACRETLLSSGRGSLSWRESDSGDSENDTNGRRRRPSHPLTQSYQESQPSIIKIGQIVNSWKISFPKTERDPDQFLLILKGLLSSSGINKDLFVPCLSKLFEGAYRSWYLVNKRSWYTWKDFARAFRYEWGVKKEDTDLLYEVRDLTIDRNESLAEFASRARLIFERMERPPPFKEQLRQILRKYPPRLMFEILNLEHRNYTEFLHYVNERNYLFKQCDLQKPRARPLKTSEFNQIHQQSDSEDELDSTTTDDEDDDENEPSTDLKTMLDNSARYVNKTPKSLTLCGPPTA